MRKQAQSEVDDYFGSCPICGQADGYANVGRSHWFYCEAHKTKWCFGANIFSSWRDETEDEQRRIYDAIGLGDFTDVNPSPWTGEAKPPPCDKTNDNSPF